MKGNPDVIERINARLAEELTAISQYFLHAEMCEDWGYKALHDVVEKRAITEMKHAEKLIRRILFLEGRPNVGVLNDLHIGDKVETQFRNDLHAELTAVEAYNDDIRAAAEAGDTGTCQLLKSILLEEEEHVDWLEAQLGQIEDMSIQNYLAENRE